MITLTLHVEEIRALQADPNHEIATTARLATDARKSVIAAQAHQDKGTLDAVLAIEHANEVIVAGSAMRFHENALKALVAKRGGTT